MPLPILVPGSNVPAVVSEIDHEYLSCFHWNLIKGKYARAWDGQNQKDLLMHNYVARQIYHERYGREMPDDWVGHHLNPNLGPLYNTRDNIEPISAEMNQLLKQSTHVHPKGKKWEVVFTRKGKRISFGVYEDNGDTLNIADVVGLNLLGWLFEPFRNHPGQSIEQRIADLVLEAIRKNKRAGKL